MLSYKTLRDMNINVRAKSMAAKIATAAMVPMPLVGHQSGFTCSRNSCQVPDHIHEAPPTDSWYFDHAGIFATLSSSVLSS